MQNLLIFFGAGLGGLSRFWISKASYTVLGTQFPYGTLVVNVTGSFIMGLISVLILTRQNIYASQLQALFMVGFLGGYTTFSSFSLETMSLIESGAGLSAAMNILLSVILCLFATFIGIILGRQL